MTRTCRSMAAQSDASGLFSQPAPSSPRASTVVGEAGRREKLYWYDSVASQVLNPYGATNFSDQTTETVWRAASKGSKRVAFHTDLTATDPWRQGVGISRSAEALLAAIDLLESDNVKQLVKEEPLARAMEEVAALKPHLAVLNSGKGSQGGPKEPTLAQLKRRRTDQTSDTAAHSEAEVRAAATTVYKWLQKENTPLRAILHILAGSGAFFAGHVAEKVLRAAAKYKPFTEDSWVEAAMARNRTQAAPASGNAAPSDSHGLFR